MSDTITCPLCHKEKSRNKLGEHLLSSCHMQRITEMLLKRRTTFGTEQFILKDGLPYIETGSKYISFCLGCKKGYCNTNTHHLESCKMKDKHRDKLRAIFRTEGVNNNTEDGDATEGSGDPFLQKRVEEMEKKLAAAEKVMEAQKRDLLSLEEQCEEHDAEMQKQRIQYRTLLCSLTGKGTMEEWEELAEKCKEKLTHLTFSATPPTSGVMFEKPEQSPVVPSVPSVKKMTRQEASTAAIQSLGYNWSNAHDEMIEKLMAGAGGSLVAAAVAPEVPAVPSDAELNARLAEEFAAWKKKSVMPTGGAPTVLASTKRHPKRVDGG